jgi:hypothetical protein
MPNFWTKATQKISETLSGPRTKDPEFEEIVKEMWMTEKGLSAIRNVFQNICNFTANFKNSAIELNNGLKFLYEKDSPYMPLAASVFQINEEMMRIADDFNKRLIAIYTETNKWNLVFNELKAKLCKREESRKIYDHYEEKMDKITKQRTEKLKRNITETPKDYEFYKRVTYCLN